MPLVSQKLPPSFPNSSTDSIPALNSELVNESHAELGYPDDPPPYHDDNCPAYPAQPRMTAPTTTHPTTSPPIRPIKPIPRPPRNHRTPLHTVEHVVIEKQLNFFRTLKGISLIVILTIITTGALVGGVVGGMLGKSKNSGLAGVGSADSTAAGPTHSAMSSSLAEGGSGTGSPVNTGTISAGTVVGAGSATVATSTTTSHVGTSTSSVTVTAAPTSTSPTGGGSNGNIGGTSIDILNPGPVVNIENGSGRGNHAGNGI